MERVCFAFFFCTTASRIVIRGFLWFVVRLAMVENGIGVALAAVTVVQYTIDASEMI